MYHFLLQISNYHYQNHLTNLQFFVFPEFPEKLKIVSSDLSIMKNIVTPVFFKSFPIKLICCGSFGLVCLLRLIAISF